MLTVVVIPFQHGQLIVAPWSTFNIYRKLGPLAYFLQCFRVIKRVPLRRPYVPWIPSLRPLFVDQLQLIVRRPDLAERPSYILHPTSYIL